MMKFKIFVLVIFCSIPFSKIVSGETQVNQKTICSTPTGTPSPSATPTGKFSDYSPL